MKIYEIAIGKTSNPNISFIKTDDILCNYIEFNSTKDRIYTDLNMVDIIDDVNLYYNYDSDFKKNGRFENMYNDFDDYNIGIAHLVSKNNETLDVRVNPKSLQPIISTNSNMYNISIVSLAINTERFSLVKEYFSGEIIDAYNSKTRMLSACIMKFNTSYSNVTRNISRIILFDKERKCFVELLMKLRANDISFLLEEYNKNNVEYQRVVSSYNPKYFRSFKLKFDNIPTKYIIYNPSAINKNTLIDIVEKSSGFTPNLINYKKIESDDKLSNFINKSLVPRNVNYVSFYGIDRVIPHEITNSMKQVFFYNWGKED